MNRLADELGIDPVELRLRNSIHEGSILSVGTPLPAGVSMPQVIERGGARKLLGAVGRSLDATAARSAGEPSAAARSRLRLRFQERRLQLRLPGANCWATVELYGGSKIEQVVIRHGGGGSGAGQPHRDHADDRRSGRRAVRMRHADRGGHRRDEFVGERVGVADDLHGGQCRARRGGAGAHGVEE